MNIGTLRYHLMILGLNHRIVTYNDDGKFVRYFTNSNTYSLEDRMIISLVRQEKIHKILNMLLETDEATNIELSNELGMQDSEVSRYTGTLMAKGIIMKNPSQTVRASYSIKKEYASHVLAALRLVDNYAITMANNDTSYEVGSKGEA